MNRNNIWIHIGLAVVLVTLAAVIGQIDRWKAALRTAPNIETPKVTIQPTRFGRDVAVSNAEVLVRFKPGVSLSAIKDIAAAKHDWHLELPAGHVEHLGGRVDNLIRREE